MAHLFPSMDSCLDFPLLVLYFPSECYVFISIGFIYDLFLFLFLIFLVVQNKDGTVAVASAFAGHKQGIAVNTSVFIFQFHSFIHYHNMVHD